MKITNLFLYKKFVEHSQLIIKLTINMFQINQSWKVVTEKLSINNMSAGRYRTPGYRRFLCSVLTREQINKATCFEVKQNIQPGTIDTARCVSVVRGIVPAIDFTLGFMSLDFYHELSVFDSGNVETSLNHCPV